MYQHAKSDVCPQYCSSIGMTHMLCGLPLQKTPPSFLNLPDDARPAPQSADTGSGLGCVNLADRRQSAFVRIRVRVAVRPFHCFPFTERSSSSPIWLIFSSTAAEAAAASGRYAQKRHMREESVMKY